MTLLWFSEHAVNILTHLCELDEDAKEATLESCARGCAFVMHGRLMRVPDDNFFRELDKVLEEARQELEVIKSDKEPPDYVEWKKSHDAKKDQKAAS